MNSVIIVGGGIAGLSAARELVRSGISVTVVEAKADFGGRIFTRHHRGLAIELGAEFLHGRSPLLLEAVGAAGLTTHQVSSHYQYFEDGALKPVKLWDKVNQVIAQVDARAPDMAFDQFLAGQNVDAQTSQLVTGFVEGFDAAYPDRISAHSLLRANYSAEQIHGEWQGRIDEGYAALVKFLLREIQSHGGVLVNGAVVREVRWKPGEVEVTVSRNGQAELFKSGAAIVTLPLGVWKAGTVSFNPPLPVKQAAAHELEFGNVMKVALVFREAWWPKDTGFVNAPGEAIPTWWTDPRGPVMVGWAGGPKADALASKMGRLEALSLEILARVFSESAGLLRSKLAAMYHHNWAADPYALGAYSYVPVNGLDLPKVLGAPVAETLFFAGEATVTDAQAGTVFGAFDTGVRAAREMAPLLERRELLQKDKLQ